MLESSRFWKYSTLLLFQLFSWRLCICHCLCNCVCLWVCIFARIWIADIISIQKMYGLRGPWGLNTVKVKVTNAHNFRCFRERLWFIIEKIVFSIERPNRGKNQALHSSIPATSWVDSTTGCTNLGVSLHQVDNLQLGNLISLWHLQTLTMASGWKSTSPSSASRKVLFARCSFSFSVLRLGSSSSW